MMTISFIIPFYNEEKRLYKTFAALRSLRLPRGLVLEKIILVNDGSTDKTEAGIKYYVNALKKYNIQIISYNKNRGKGYAVRQGMLRAPSDYNLFFDADMSVPLTEIRKFLPFMKRGADVVVGTRKNSESTVVRHQPLYREILGKGFTFLAHLLIGVVVTDFTCGFKAFSRKSTRALFGKSKINGWGYDAEILYVAKKANFSIEEKAVFWADERNSKVNLFIAVPQSLYDLFLIHWHHTIKFYLQLLYCYIAKLLKTRLLIVDLLSAIKQFNNIAIKQVKSLTSNN